MARQGDDVAVFKHLVGSEDDLNRLIAVRRHRAIVVPYRGEMYDPEVDLGCGDVRPVSRAERLGSQAKRSLVLLFLVFQ